MKSLLVVISLVLVNTAFGDYVPGRERPVQAGVLNITYATGEYADVQQVKLVRTTGSLDAGFHLVIDGKAKKYSVTDRTTGCGSIFYKAIPMEFHNGTRISELHIEDHSKRICDDIVTAPWVITLVSGSTLPKQPRSELHAEGRMRPVFTTLVGVQNLPIVEPLTQRSNYICYDTDGYVVTLIQDLNMPTYTAKIERQSRVMDQVYGLSQAPRQGYKEFSSQTSSPSLSVNLSDKIDANGEQAGELFYTNERGLNIHGLMKCRVLPQFNHQII